MAALEGLISGPFARELEEGRGRYNAAFLDAARRHPSLDQKAFADVLASTVAPIVNAVDRIEPRAVRVVTESLYELSLELLIKELLGPSSRYPVIAEAWRTLLPQVAGLVAAAPQRFVGSITNALYNLARTPGARPEQWLADMKQLAAVDGTDVESLLGAGQVAAWRAGLAHYRDGAIAACRELSATLAVAALGLSGQPPIPVEELLTRLEKDPWLTPSTALTMSTRRRPRIVMRVGAFRGFGGLFMRPPAVRLIAGQFVVEDGLESWTLVADCFGATLHRSTLAGQRQPSINGESQPAFRLDRRGHVIPTSGSSAEIAELKDARTWASDRHTLAVTTSLSHSVFLVAAVTDERESSVHQSR